MSTTDEEPSAELSSEDCWTLLGMAQFGRLAYRLVDEVHLVPINYVADAGSLLFRTASGNKLLAAAMHSEVAFEIDWVDDDVAWSVVVRGRLHRVPEDQAHRADELPLRPWVTTFAHDLVELVPHGVTGRRFRLTREAGDHPSSTR